MINWEKYLQCTKDKWCDVVIYISLTYLYLVFVLSSWLTATKTLGISSSDRKIKVSLVMLMSDLEVTKNGGWLPGEPTK